MTMPIPTDTCAIKLASLARHADELIDSLVSRNPNAIETDIQTIRSLLSDHEVMAYLIALDRLALLPVKR